MNIEMTGKNRVDNSRNSIYLALETDPNYNNITIVMNIDMTEQNRVDNSGNCIYLAFNTLHHKMLFLAIQMLCLAAI